jgi:hypothetical protein
MSLYHIEAFAQTRFIAQKIIRKSTCQFFTLEGNVPKPLGSGVCVQVGAQRYILTAAHVLDGCIDTIHFKSATGLFHSFFEVISLKIDVPRAVDKNDTALIIVTEEMHNLFNGCYSFISPNELGINHDLLDNDSYAAFGFPASSTKIKMGERCIKDIGNFITARPSQLAIYNVLGCNFKENIVIGYKKKKMVDMKTNKRGEGVNPFGMSGGGLWYVPVQPNVLNPVKFLVGILTEWPIKNRNYLICTRIDAFTEILRQTDHPELPKSRFYSGRIYS